MEEQILEKVYKPARYLGNEYNSVKKDLNSIYLKVALCFPDIYEVGMSHLGFRIIYGLLNEIKDVVCERIFMPTSDLEDILYKNNIPLTSLESNIPISQFDIVGFSLSYELLYINILNILKLANIPLYAKERSDEHPLVIAGGYACINPEPMTDFFDCFIIGEAEELILELIDKVKTAKLRHANRKQLLIELSRIEGVYVPSLYTIEYNQDGTIKTIAPEAESAPSRIRKRFVADLDSAFFPNRWLIPYTQIVHDRLILEIMRGCPNNCMFCQAKSVYYPYRLRSQTKIIKLSKSLLKCSGYEDISLLGLSCGDHPQIRKILTKLISCCKHRGISVSLPSLKAKDYIRDFPFLLKTIKKTGLTFAPEAGTERLRKIINKNIDIKALFNVVSSAYKAGYRHIKLYFMVGLPYEKLSDLNAIVELAVNVVGLRKEIDGKFGNVTLSISPFIPKPHTAFEKLNMETVEELKRRQAYLFSKVRKYLRVDSPSSVVNKSIKIDFHNPEISFLEAVLSRADRRVGQVIYNAFRLGACANSGKSNSLIFFDKKEWVKFNLDIWLKAFEQAGINPYFYVHRRIGHSETLPWSHIDIGIDKNQKSNIEYKNEN